MKIYIATLNNGDKIEIHGTEISQKDGEKQIIVRNGGAIAAIFNVDQIAGIHKINDDNFESRLKEANDKIKQAQELK